MLKRVDETRQTCRLVYICFLIVYMAVREVIPLQFLIDTVPVSGAVFGLGAVWLVWDLLTARTCLRARGADLLWLFVLVCGISAVLRVRYGVGGNVKAIGALILEYGVLYAAAVDRSERQRSRDLRVFSIVLSGVWCIPVLLSVCMYVFDVEYVVFGSTQGFHSEYFRLWGVFQDPAYASFISLVTMYASVYLMTQYRRWWVYLLCSLQLLLQLSYVVLGGTRSALLLLPVSALVYGAYVFRSAAPRSNVRKLLGCVAALGIGVGSLCLVVGLQYGLPLCKNAVRTVFPDAAGVHGVYDRIYAKTDAVSIESDPDSGEEGFIHRTDTDKADVSNGRFTRWKDALTVFWKSPVIGTSPRNVSAYAKQHAPDTLMAKYDIAPHNGFLDLLVGTGCVGFAVMLTFLALAAWWVTRLLCKQSSAPETAFSAIVVFLLIGSAVFISDVFMFFTEGAVLFWLMLGYTVHTDLPAQENSVCNRCVKRLFIKRKG